MVIEKANVSAGRPNTLQVSGLNGGSSCPADVGITPPARRIQNRDGGVDDHFGIRDAKAVSTLRNLSDHIRSAKCRTLVDARSVWKKPDITSHYVIGKSAPGVGRTVVL